MEKKLIEQKIIFPDSEEAATYRTDISGWVSSTGHFFGKDEQAARYKGSTHTRCECGEAAKHPYTACEECRRKKMVERYNALPFKEWDGKEALCVYGDDKYFFSEEDLLEYLYEHEMNGSDIMLVLCAPIYYQPIDMDTIASDAWEGWEPDAKLEKLVSEFNKKLKELPPHSFTQGKTRTSYNYTYKPED